ncbi:MAG TPA: hypothetical protein PKD84_11835 [Propionicimonas sp.]|jgi:hypothetical protein|nr:hypothetical protein [Propionicimonas sp.]
MTKEIMNIRIATALTALALGITLTGCTSGSNPAASQAPQVDPSRVSPTYLPTPPSVKDSQGDIKDLVMGDCQTEAGKQSIDGTLTSSLADTADFLVTVSWTNATGDVMGRGFSVIQDLKPGKTATFTITAKVAPGATQCVKGVEYGTIKG